MPCFLPVSFFPFEGRKGYYLLNGTKKVVMRLLSMLSHAIMKPSLANIQSTNYLSPPFTLKYR